MTEEKKTEKTGRTVTEPRFRLHHRILWVLLRPIVALICLLRYGIKAERFREQGDRAYLILYNHQTPFDQFFVTMSFRGPVCYLATEDIFSNGGISSVIRWAAAPVPIRKGTMDTNAIRQLVAAAKEGNTIAIAPEGNRTYSGKTEYINPSIVRLAKMLHLPIAIYRIEGGYGAEPRWSDRVRKGKMRSYVSRVIEPEEYEKLSKDAFYTLVCNELMVNEAESGGIYRSARRAEYLERAVYVCPQCGPASFESRGNEIECLSCHRKVRYGEDKRHSGIGFDFPFSTVNDWYEYQNRFVRGLDLTEYCSEPVFRDRADISEVIVFKEKRPLLKDAGISLYGDRIEVNEGAAGAFSIPFAEVTAAAVLGHNKLNIYHGDRILQFKGSKRFNALKYVNFYYRHHAMQRGDANGEFLGL